MPSLLFGQQIDAATGLIYDTAVTPSRWPALLASLGAAFNSHFVDTYSRTDDFSRFRGLAHGMNAAEYQTEFLEAWAKRNAWSKRNPARVAGEVISTREMVSPADLMRDPMYDGFLARRGLHEGLRLVIWADDGWIRDISLLRAWSDGPFAPAEMAAARLLMPHLRRAFSLARRIGATTAGSPAIDQITQPAFLLDGDGHLLRTNGAGDALLAAGNGLLLLGGQVVATSPADTALLLNAAVAGAGRAGIAPRSSAVVLRRGEGRPPLTLSLLPVREEADWVALREPAVLAVVQPAVMMADPFARFGLTPAEASVARDLLAGLRVAEIAERSGRSVNTVRTHLTNVMGKTQTRRQAELVRRLMS